METPSGQAPHHSKRDLGLDTARVIAAFAVVFCHAALQYFAQSFPSAEWEARNVLVWLSHWPVPVFVMISGALFLDPLRQVPLRRLFGHNVLRLASAYVVWSLVYGTYDLWLAGGSPSAGWLAATLLTGPVHLWFLKMLVGLYVAIPVLRAVVRDERAERCFLILALATMTVLPLCEAVAGHAQPELGRLLHGAIDTIDLRLAAGFSGYFVLGHYLHRHRPGATACRALLVLAVVATVALTAISHHQAHLAGKAWADNDVFGPLTLLQVVAVYVWCLRPRRLGRRMQRCIGHAASVSFGIYLTHVLVMYVARYQLGIDRPMFTPWLFIPLHGVGLYVVAYALSSVLRRLPGVRHWLV